MTIMILFNLFFFAAGNSSGTLAGPTTLPNCGGKPSSSKLEID